MIFALYFDNPAYDQTFLQNYAQINIVTENLMATLLGRAPGPVERGTLAA